ncbi:helix-turn-helix domain-containing protein [Nocardia arizonensis]|uniref:helix-turn-helix domain-containing protein n=1 Tax=Nocardia arizonensis TaxID=1141647 RepID=UPI000A8E2EA1|nr:helix-turn-helix domain-containing protein [Nocardia arizonensis]
MGLIRRYSNLYSLSHLQEVIARVSAAQKRQQVHGQPPVRRYRIDRRLTPEVIAELVDAYRQGTSTPTLCEQYNLSKGSVLKLLAQHGITMRHQPLTDLQIDRAVEQYRAGDSLATIAKQLDSAATTIRSALAARGIGMRPAGGGNPMSRRHRS